MFPFYFKCGRLVSRLLELRNLLLCWSGFFLSVTKCLVFLWPGYLPIALASEVCSVSILTFFDLVIRFYFCLFLCSVSLKKKKNRNYTLSNEIDQLIYSYGSLTLSLSLFFFFYSYRGNWYTLGIKSASELATFWFGGGGVCNFALEKWLLLGMLTLNDILGGGIVT